MSLKFKIFLVSFLHLSFVSFSICPQRSDWVQPTFEERFYTNWKDGNPLAEINVLETFEDPEVKIFDHLQLTEKNQELTVVRVDKVYTGCPPQTPYYVLAKNIRANKGGPYIVPLPLRNESEPNKTYYVSNICPGESWFMYHIGHLRQAEKDFLDSRISCCQGKCTCLGNDRSFSTCDRNTCYSKPPCAAAQVCRINPCNNCAEEWFTNEWQVPCK